MDGRATAGTVSGRGPTKERLCWGRLVSGSVSKADGTVTTSGEGAGVTEEGLLIEVDDKVPERVWDANSWEETSNRRVEAS